MIFSRRVWRSGTSKVVSVPKDLELGFFYEFEVRGVKGVVRGDVVEKGCLRHFRVDGGVR